MLLPQPSRTPSQFELLPGELRNLIYRHAFVQEGLVKGATRIDTKKKLWRSNEPALARTCRLFRKEVLEIYYRENAFTFPKSDPSFVHRRDVELWLLAIGEAVEWIEWVGAELVLLREREDGRLDRERCEVKARIIPDDCEAPTSNRAVKRPRNHPCECGLDDPSLCVRVSPLEVRVSADLSDYCGCREDALEVCSRVFESLPRTWELAYAVHFCSNYICWRNGWDSPSNHPTNRRCPRCEKTFAKYLREADRT